MVSKCRIILLLSFILICHIHSSFSRTPLQSLRRTQRGFAGHREEDERFIVPNSRFRLNNTFIPEHYEIEFVIILDEDPDIGTQFTAPGKIKIIGTPTNNTSTITLHANLLRIEYDTLMVTKLSDPSFPIQVTGYSNDTNSERHFFTVDVNSTLESGLLYQLEMEFVAPISTDRRNGLYLSTYIDPQTGEQQRQAATQMEPVQARTMFPCFDEPGLKSTFNVTLIRKNNYKALANGDLMSSVPDQSRPGWTIDTFATTPRMPTYLFAIFVSHFTFVEVPVNTPSGDVLVRVHGPPDMIARGGGNYTVQATANVFRAFNDYFDTPNYPFSKMDSVAVPVKGGAMENWALILYRSDLLMYFNGETTESKRYDITDVIAHEVAHQNFGNLVTCKWWSVLWLNEGFATWISHLGVNLTYPEFQPFDYFINELFQYAMVFDASDESHPLFNDAETPQEIDDIFSSITYEKGASIIRMIANVLTEPTLQQGLQYYLKEMEYMPVEQDDLYRNLQRAVDEDGQLVRFTVKDILDTWTMQKGFPLVKVSTIDSVSISVTQERFRTDVSDPSDLWYVPISLASKENQDNSKTVPDFWLAKNESTITIQHDTTSWIIVNLDAIGYYRVQYDSNLLDLLKSQLLQDSSMISHLSRSQLLDDYFTLAFDERISVTTAMELTQYMETEDHFTVWNVVFTQLLKAYNIFMAVPAEESFELYFVPRIDAALTKVGVEQTEFHIGAVAMYRERLLDWACAMNSSLCVAYAQRLLSEWESNPDINPIHADIQPIMYCAIVSSTAMGYDFIFSKFKSETDPSKQILLLNSLACGAERFSFKLFDLISNFLTGSTYDITQAEAQTIFKKLATDPWGSDICFDFLTQQLANTINIIFGGSLASIAEVIESIIRYNSSPETQDYMIFWFNQNAITFSPIRPRLDAAVNGMNDNIAWMNKFGFEMLDYFKMH